MIIYLLKLLMPFKTRASKQKASLKWTTLVEGGQAKYISKSRSLKGDNVPDETQLVQKQQKIYAEPNIKTEIVKIALMALLVIGFQIVLKFSHIGF
ncbi:hypothetical protein A3A60_04270 [Candidatus Curtissbacteria bacterium RIFCSPLOWO2_01_FULL_42_26]|uniref:Uncharacterized protein n=1 Tax=Candidatus Curtissbacteria bacterium RIFCSPLOWO2_01_FULL_42_26 TaxID=1797729 RepID=A0A1F5I0M7_9BACT|nr:MAG: hypothetical protein A3A60_04270 [Candidatus Curtissbacteria bacterium RIFCSPLOWO2_01_FULL_42_26]